MLFVCWWGGHGFWSVAALTALADNMKGSDQRQAVERTEDWHDKDPWQQCFLFDSQNLTPKMPKRGFMQVLWHQGRVYMFAKCYLSFLQQNVTPQIVWGILNKLWKWPKQLLSPVKHSIVVSVWSTCCRPPNWEDAAFHRGVPAHQWSVNQLEGFDRTSSHTHLTVFEPLVPLPTGFLWTVSVTFDV